MSTREPLVMLPGLLLDERLYAAQVHVLSAERPVQVMTLLDQASMADMAMAVLREAPPRFALCGLSMGGYAAFEIMRRAPERVSRLALLDTQARADTPEATERRKDLLALAERGGLHGVTDRLIPLFVHERRAGDPALRNLLVAMAATVGVGGFGKQQTAIMGRADRRAELASIACPTLVLCGRQDALTPVALHEEMAAGIDASTLVVLPDCGHLSPLEQPEMVTRQLAAWLMA